MGYSLQLHTYNLFRRACILDLFQNIFGSIETIDPDVGLTCHMTLRHVA